MTSQITETQFSQLELLIDEDDRVGYYVKLHEYTGSTTALLMAQISSASGVVGGAAWNINLAYAAAMPTYPEGGTTAFSRDISRADLDLIRESYSSVTGLYDAPSDKQMLLNAYDVWDGYNSGYLFPGNVFIANNYLGDGDFASAAIFASYAAMTSAWVASLGMGDAVWELFDSRYNSGQSIAELLEENPGSFVSVSADGMVKSVVGLDGKTIGAFADSLLDVIPIQLLHDLRAVAQFYLDMPWKLPGLNELRSTMFEMGEALNDLFNAARSVVQQRDPLVLDLDGDGLDLAPASSNLLFDHNADGIKTGTGWARPDDGFLVRDLNSNGLIDSGRELFGVDTVKRNGQLATQGFDALSDLDSNADGQITSADAAWSELQVWRDLNQDGITQSGELNTLTSLNISSINLNGTAAGPQAGQTVNNNRIALSTTFTQGGETRTVGAIDLESNPFFSHIPAEQVDETGSPVTLTEAAAALPQMNGSGMVRNLRAAMSQAGAAADELEAAVVAFA
ncbi:MAG: hypothetical protein Q7T95_01270, partial [Hydrogenophaga sp.]|nr:hypothetical protein [Hydrogenophaga sp.]